MKYPSMVVWACAFLLMWMAQTVFAETDRLPPDAVELEKAVHFISPGGEPVEVPPGPYRLGAAEEELKLISFEGGDVLSIQAKADTHEETISEPVTESASLEEDSHYLALLLPDGQVFEAVGSYSGVRSRGSLEEVFLGLQQKIDKARRQAKSKAARQKVAVGSKPTQEQRAKVTRIAKFPYWKPDLNLWVRYCDNHHRKNALKKCCVRRNKVCEARCQKKKTRYPNTAYETKSQCLQDCERVHVACADKAVARSKSAPNQQGKTVAEGLGRFGTCMRMKNLVDRNECCTMATLQCSSDTGEDIESCLKYSNKTCLKRYSKREAEKILAKRPNPQWMKTYCSKKANLKDDRKDRCCGRMNNRCNASCDGLYPNPHVKNSGNVYDACMSDCFKANEICLR